MDKNSKLWEYLSPEMKDLITDGEALFEEAKNSSRVLTDYSYLVFSTAKAFEGFLKKIFLELKIINEEVYASDHFRIGKALNPHIDPWLKRESCFEKISDKLGTDLTMDLWEVWKKGRNLVFHYFPGHLRCLRRSEAEALNKEIEEMMERIINEVL